MVFMLWRVIKTDSIPVYFRPHDMVTLGELLQDENIYPASMTLFSFFVLLKLHCPKKKHWLITENWHEVYRIGLLMSASQF